MLTIQVTYPNVSASTYVKCQTLTKECSTYIEERIVTDSAGYGLRITRHIVVIHLIILLPENILVRTRFIDNNVPFDNITPI